MFTQASGRLAGFGLRAALALVSTAFALSAHAQITYVDASAANTTGSAYVSTANIYTDNLWSIRAVTTADAVGGTVFEAGPEGGSENAPVLATTLTGLVPGQTYDLHAYFVTFPASDATQLWRIRAGLAADLLTGYDRDSAATSVVPDGSATALATPAGAVVVVPTNRDYRQASLGQAEADASGRLTVYIDSGLGANDANHRAWYDGIGYKVATTAASASSPPTLVDPAAGVTASWSAEWTAAGDAEGWTATHGQVSVADGVISLAASADPAGAPSLRVSALAAGPDLDLGFNDFLELRLRVPADYTGPVKFYFGTTAANGFSGERSFTLPADLIPRDGAFHAYRLDLGLEVFWRTTLRDLRLDFTGSDAAGKTFALDHVRVGDEPDARVYQPRVNGEHPNVGGTVVISGTPRTVVGVLESKHFRYVWDSTVASHGSWNANLPRATLRHLEECWQLFAKKLGYREPCFATGATSGTPYKVNVTSWYSGYWAGLDGGYGKLNITPDGLTENPPSGVISHELMHVFQFHNTTNYVPGAWWEGHANYGRERILQHFGALYPANQRSGIDPTYLRCAHQTIAHGRDYYLSWPLFLYLDENPDALPDLGEGTLVKLWQQTPINEYPLMTLERLTPTSSLKDIVGLFARRQATFDYASQANIVAALARFGAPLDNAATDRWRFTELEQRPDAPAWWRVPHEMAPMQGAYALHELIPAGTGAGRVVTVNFRGLPDTARGADWRASFIAIADDGAERYGTLWGQGENSIILGANENRLYLSVAGAPAVFHVGAPNASFEGDFNEAVYPYRSAPSKTRFPYELQVTGATPKQRTNGPATGLVQHANGGGYRASTATVASTVYIAPGARVLGTANVSGNARIEDHALVSGNAVISGNAIVSGHAWVRGGTVTQNAKVRDWALVEGGTLSGNARVLERANFKGGSATDLVTLKGTAATTTGALTGNAILDGDYGDFFSGRAVANAVAFGHQPYVGVPDHFLRALPAGLYASYDFAASHDSRVLDQPGVTDGFTVGSPAWISADARRQGFLTFDGATQSVLLDRSVADLRDFTFTAWVKPSGGAPDQALLWLGASTSRRLVLTPADSDGRPRFSIVNGGIEQTLVAPAALPLGVWSHLAVTLDSATATGALYVNGVAVATGPITLRPDQLLPANTATALAHHYLGRAEGNARPFYCGALDEVRFYATALSAADLAALQPATDLATAGTLHVDLRAEDASAGAATWINRAGTGDFIRTGTPSKVANVSATQIPGVQFDGVSQAYTGPATSTDLDGASDRSIEVWAYNPVVTEEESLVSWSYRGSEGRAMSFNHGSPTSYSAVSHWGGNYDLGWNPPPSAGAWHHLVYTYDGAVTARVYVNGVLSTSKTLPAPLATFAGQPINLACQRNTPSGTRSKFFAGYLNTVRIHGGVLSPAQIASNHQIGPSGAPANLAPTLSAFADLALAPDAAPVAVPFTIGDTDTALAALSVSVASDAPALLPPAALVLSGTGASRTLTVTPAPGATGEATVTVTVGDGLAATTRTFTVTVTAPTALENWRETHFGTAIATGDAADTADPDADGLANLLEFFLHGDPALPDVALIAPVIAREANMLTLTYTRSKAATADFTGTVEWTDSLTAPAWSTTGVTETILADDGTTQTIRATVPLGTPARFLRLRVQANAP